MKRTTLISLTAAISLGACHDVTAPEPRTEPRTAPAHAARALAKDSSAVWASMALDDAATRLLSGVADGDARTDLERALHVLSAQLGRRDDAAAARACQEAAGRALAQLREQSDVAALPDLDAIGLALDGAAAVLNSRSIMDAR